jgi:CHASE2 domain-containing sensor protein
MKTQLREFLTQSVGPYLAAAAVLVLLRSMGLAQTIDLVLYDLITNQRPQGSGRDTPITLVGIEESDIQRFGWPIDDGLFCKAIDTLEAQGVQAIGFDLYRDKGVGPNQECLRDRFRNQPTLVSIFNVAAGIPAVPGTPIERQSYNDMSLDADGVMRRDLVHVTGQDEATVSFPMRVLEVATGDRSIRTAIDAGTHRDAWLTANGGGYHNAIDAGLGFQRLLQFREPGSYPMVSLAALLEGNVQDHLIQDRIVLIGSTAPSLRDLFEVPHLDRSPQRRDQPRLDHAWMGQSDPGVELGRHRTGPGGKGSKPTPERPDRCEPRRRSRRWIEPSALESRLDRNGDATHRAAEHGRCGMVTARGRQPTAFPPDPTAARSDHLTGCRSAALGTAG